MRKYLFILATAFATPLFSQSEGANEDGNFQMTSLAGLLRATATVTPAWAVGVSSNNATLGSATNDKANIYLHGTLEYYFDQHFSVRSDAAYFLNKDKDPGGLLMNHTVQLGIGWHLLKSLNYDPFIGVSSGVSFVRAGSYTMFAGTDTVGRQVAPNMEIVPVWGPRVGFNFFTANVFHFFVEAQYLMGTYRPNGSLSRNMNELRVSAGIGLNFVFLHKEGTVRQNI
jgi:hypothetical protein